jgi:hypothetical protein
MRCNALRYMILRALALRSSLVRPGITTTTPLNAAIAIQFLPGICSSGIYDQSTSFKYANMSNNNGYFSCLLFLLFDLNAEHLV